MIRRPPRSTPKPSSAASDVYKRQIYNDLGKIIINPELGRKNNDDITVADLTGTGVQDTAIARYAYEIALNKKLGKNVD